jgi:hypothetical protein
MLSLIDHTLGAIDQSNRSPVRKTSYANFARARRNSVTMWSFGCAIQSRTPIDNETRTRYALEYHVQWLDSPKYSANAQLLCLTRAHVCIRLFFFSDSLKICWEYTTTHHRCH